MSDEPIMRTCEECGAEYERGKGVSEEDSHSMRLTERFCSDGCALDYAAEIEDALDEADMSASVAELSDVSKVIGGRKIAGSKRDDVGLSSRLARNPPLEVTPSLVPSVPNVSPQPRDSQSGD